MLMAERPWHGLTFAGTQVSLKLTLSGQDHTTIAADVNDRLNEQEFDIPGQLVADIAVTKLMADGSRTILVIEALLLED